jgi:UDP-glucose 4-epimerase
MKILLTGGAGFIGSNLLDMYVNHGHNVTIIDNFRSGRIENIKHHINNKQVNFMFGDILDEEFLKSLPTDFDLINHHAAQLEITRCISYPQEDLKSNIFGTTNILEFAKKCKKLRLFIYVSSAAVYGQAKSKLQKESDPIDPHWVYGVSKYSTELLANIYCKALGIPFVGIRYSIIYGIREWFGRVLTLFIKNSINDKKIVVFGKGQEIRDYLNVKDVVEFHRLLLEKKLDASNHIYNVSSGRKTSIRELASLISEINQCKIIYENVKEGESSKILNNARIRLPGNLEYLCMDNSKAKREIDWHPKISIKEGALEELKWYEESAKRDTKLWERMFY